ncbi:hypothetical protein WR25_12388 isoform B [Diploscapter pachys]|uniref:Fucosyltransferase n=1 Tax=Diploscapter pachys TaxID=2018661 RepID=A0A2A2J9L7_9BILA|nr:hypothetical protein WR25_12388 isoform B [Diploscapter pachys]
MKHFRYFRSRSCYFRLFIALIVAAIIVILFGICYTCSCTDISYDQALGYLKSLQTINAGGSVTYPKRILFWTNIFGEDITSKVHNFYDCPENKNRCVIDSNKLAILASDAIVFHSRDISNQGLADLLKISCLPDKSLRNPDQIYVYYTMESPSNSGYPSTPANFFNWTMTFVAESDIQTRYGPHFMKIDDAKALEFEIKDFAVDENRYLKKNSGIFWLVSNCNTDSKREKAVAELAKYIDVKIVGKCADNDVDKNLCPKSESCNDQYENYPFYIAMENSNCKDYITEKLYQRIHIPSIPIVSRRRIYENAGIPSSSFIALDDFSGPKELAEYLKILQTNITAYKHHMEWRKKWTIAPLGAAGLQSEMYGMCQLCDRLWESSKTHKSIDDINSHYEKLAACENGDAFLRKWIPE